MVISLCEEKKVKKELMVAIIGAVSAYIQQEEVINAYANLPAPCTEISSWRLLKQHELMRAKTNWRVKRGG